jgi:hypothetical protein
VVVGGRLPDVQVGPVGRRGPRGREEPLLDGELVAVDEPGRLAAEDAAGHAVAGRVQHGRPVHASVQQRHPLLERALGRVFVVRRLGECEVEEAVGRRRGPLAHHGEPGHPAQLFEDVRRRGLRRGRRHQRGGEQNRNGEQGFQPRHLIPRRVTVFIDA